MSLNQRDSVEGGGAEGDHDFRLQQLYLCSHECRTCLDFCSRGHCIVTVVIPWIAKHSVSHEHRRAGQPCNG